MFSCRISVQHAFAKAFVVYTVGAKTKCSGKKDVGCTWLLVHFVPAGSNCWKQWQPQVLEGEENTQNSSNLFQLFGLYRKC